MTDAPKPDDVTAISEWMRWPDNAPSVTLEGVADWVNRRPVAAFERLAADNVRLTRERDEATARRPEDDAACFVQAAIDSAPEPLRRLGEWLANKLDDDDWKTADRLVTGAAVSLSDALAAARAENDRLREALRFYGDRSSYRSRIGMDSPITHDDFGARARAALEQGGGDER